MNLAIMKSLGEMGDTMFNSGISSLACPLASASCSTKQNWRRRIMRIVITLLLATVSGLMFALPAQSATVFSHPPAPLSEANTIGSNAVTNPDGSDRDVTAFDSFTLSKSAVIKSVAWRGTSADKGLAGFTIKIYASSPNPAAQADTAAPLSVTHIAGNASEKPVGNHLSDYRADITEPLALTGGVKYWISIVSDRHDLSSWGWANGTGGDGKTIQHYSELRVLAAPGDRAFYFDDGIELGQKH